MIVRRKHTTSYTVVPNGIINDERMTADVLGLLVYLLSKPDDWSVSIKAIAATKRFGAHGKVCAALARLREYGYVTMSRSRTGETEWCVYDHVFTPHSQNRNEGLTHIPETGMREPHSENPHVGNRNVLLSTEFNQVLKKEEEVYLEPSTEAPRTVAKKPKARKSDGFDPLAIVIPESIPADIWADFVEHRKIIKAPLTAIACRNLFAEIARWPDQSLVGQAFRKCIATARWVVPYQPEPSQRTASRQPFESSSVRHRRI